MESKETSINQNGNFQEKPTRDLIKELLIEWSMVSTSHGWPSIFRVKRLKLKVMWFICFIIATGFCGFGVIKSILDFLDYDVVTKIRLVQEKPITYPAVTICNLNPLVTSKANSFILKYFSESFAQNFTNFSNLIKYSNENEIKLLSKYDKIIQQIADPDFGDAEKRDSVLI